MESGKISGDGKFTIQSQALLQESFGFKKVLLTTSCTDALEMAALLLDINPGDEVIMPSYNFVSAANAFALRGAKVVFADIDPATLNVDPQEVEKCITPRTKAIIVVHYGGVACDMPGIMSIAEQHQLKVVEDTALAFDSYYVSEDGERKPLGTFGDFGTLSFHETKNIIAGEGGAIIINSEKYISRAEIIREKGTDRSRLFRGEIDKYRWQDLGSSFLPSDITAAFLYGQLENKTQIQDKRKALWYHYYSLLKPLKEQGLVRLPFIPSYATVNGQMFWMLCQNEKERDQLIEYLKKKGVKAVFHYLPLHLSPWYSQRYNSPNLPVTESVADNIIRLPLYYELSTEEVEFITSLIKQFLTKQSR